MAQATGESTTSRAKASKAKSKPVSSGSSDKAAPTTIKDNQRAAIRATLHDLLSHTKPSSTICPSQVPRKLHDIDPKTFPDWRVLMEAVREVVWEEVGKNVVQVSQGGEVKELSDREGIRGPIRLKRGLKWVPQWSGEK